MNLIEKVNYRHKGKRVMDASSKVSVGTIPSKFETIIYKNNNVKAFNSSTTRFFEREEERPGPGHYKNVVPILTQEHPESESKKGFGNGFITNQNERNPFQMKYVNSGPGPGNYNYLENSELLNQRRQNQRGSSMFLAKGRNVGNQNGSGSGTQSQPNLPKVVLEAPGPGEYNPRQLKSQNSYKSSFVSGTGREKHFAIASNPPPGSYNIQGSVMRKKNFKHKGFSSSFCNPSEKKTNKNQMKELMKFLDEEGKKGLKIQDKQINPEENLQVPGPGYYEAKIPAFQPDYTLMQSSSNFKEGIRDRFGDFKDKSKEKKSAPGPMAYKVEDYGMNKLQNDRALVSGSAFMSETNRKPYGQFDAKIGPSTIIPYMVPNKKSFHLNLGRNWI